MFQNLSVRAVIPVATAVTGFVIVCSLLLYSMIKEDLVKTDVIHSTNLAHALVKSTRFAMLHDDRETLKNLINNVGEQPGVEHVRIFSKKGLIAFSTDKLEVARYVDKNTAGCVNCHAGPVPKASLEAMQQARTFTNAHGNRVIAVTAVIRNEAECSNGACHVHPASQKILGTLDVGLDQAPLQKSLASLRWSMLLFTAMILCLTVGGVAAILSRSVFLPLKALTNFTEQLAGGKTNASLPEIGGELGELAACVRQIDNRRQEAEKSLERLIPAVCVERRREFLKEFPGEVYDHDGITDKSVRCFGKGIPIVAAADPD